MSASPPPARLEVSLDRFEGPLDLLLALIRKNEMSIEDLPVAEITRQYLDYVRRAKEMDINLGADFAYTAATLIQIKTRSLLPSDPSLTAREPDLRQELIRELLDHDQVRRAAAFLQNRLAVSAATWSKASADEEALPGAELVAQGGRPLTVLDVVTVTRRALDAARDYRESKAILDATAAVPEVPVSRMIAYVEQALAKRRGPIPAELLFGEQSSLSELVALFLAMLELCRAGKVGLEQDRTFGPILVTAQ